MHEIGIMQQAVAMALSAAETDGANRISRIRLDIGRLAGVAPEALEFAFEAVTHGTIAQGAKFEWNEVPVECGCQNGCPSFRPSGVIFRCPCCEVISIDIRHGRELTLAEIDVES